MWRISCFSGPTVARPRPGAKSKARVILLAGLLLLVGDAARAEELILRARPVALDPANPQQRRVGGLLYLGGLALTSPDDRFGGLSGLAVTDGGARLLAVSDRGQWITAALVHDADGALVGIGAAEIMAMGGSDGAALTGHRRDAEDIAPLGDGGFGVSFERDHRILLYPGDPFVAGNNRGQAMALSGALRDAPDNRGIEALAEIAPDRLLAVTEGLFDRNARLVGRLFSIPGAASAPRVLTYETEDQLRPTALAVLPGGDLLALERSFSLAGGLKVRLVRIARADITAGGVLAPKEVMRFGHGWTVDNFEGLAVVRDDRGRTLVYMISDDNFSIFQRTLLMQFQLVY